MVLKNSEVWDLRALRCFLSVARHNSLTRASVELGVSESAVSQRLKSLERAMGLKLYESPGGRFRITPTGSRLIEMAVDVFNRIDGFRAELGAGQPAGSLAGRHTGRRRALRAARGRPELRLPEPGGPPRTDDPER